jgi:hypothetical protein
LGASAFAAGCGDDGSHAPPRAKFTRIDEIKGADGPVAIGDRSADVHSSFGKATPAAPNEPITPTGAPQYFRGPGTIFLQDTYAAKPKSEPTFRYADVSFFLVGDRVAGFMITSPGARTRANVGVGSPLDRVRAAYRLRCGTANASNGERDHFPACTGRVAPRRYIWFGGDPVENITMSIRPLGGL